MLRPGEHVNVRESADDLRPIAVCLAGRFGRRRVSMKFVAAVASRQQERVRA